MEKTTVELDEIMPIQTQPTKKVQIIAHRGASYDAPENTLSSFRLGWEQRADAVELDIYLSRDEQIVVMHDDNTKRTAGLDKKIADQTLTELRQLDAGSWKHARFAGEKIPTLDEVIKIIPNGKKLVIEIKCGPEVIPALKQSLARSGKPDNAFTIIAFSYPTLQATKKALPQIEMYWLSSFRPGEGNGPLLPTAKELIAGAKAANFDGLNLAYTGPLDTAFIQQVHDAGLKCYTWTVDKPEDARRLINAGIDGITTNRPGWLRQQVL